MDSFILSFCVPYLFRKEDMSLWEAGKTGWPDLGWTTTGGCGESQKQHNGEGGVKVNVQHGMSRSGMVMLVLVRHFLELCCCRSCVRD